jgi:hypothetical protein
MAVTAASTAVYQAASVQVQLALALGHTTVLGAAHAQQADGSKFHVTRIQYTECADI